MVEGSDASRKRPVNLRRCDNRSSVTATTQCLGTGGDEDKGEPNRADSLALSTSEMIARGVANGERASSAKLSPKPGRIRRDGDIVYRPKGFWSPAVHGLLEHPEAVGSPLLGFSEGGPIGSSESGVSHTVPRCRPSGITRGCRRGEPPRIRGRTPRAADQPVPTVRTEGLDECGRPMSPRRLLQFQPPTSELRPCSVFSQ